MSDLVGLQVLFSKLPGTVTGVGGIEVADGVAEPGPTNVSANAMSRFFLTASGFVDSRPSRAQLASGLPYKLDSRRPFKGSPC